MYISGSTDNVTCYTSTNTAVLHIIIAVYLTQGDALIQEMQIAKHQVKETV